MSTENKAETTEYFYKVVRMRTNGKIHVYPEIYLDIDSAIQKMVHSATGKYKGKCYAYIFKVNDHTSTKVKSFGVDGKELGVS